MKNMLTIVYGSFGATAREPDEITFGRSTQSTIKLDRSSADSALSRHCGTIWSSGDGWQFLNTSRRSTIAINVEGGTRVELAPGSGAFTFASPSAAELILETLRTYTLHVNISGAPGPGPLPAATSETTTIHILDELSLNERERQYLVALSEPRLRNPSAPSWEVPSTKDLQSKLGCTAKQLEKLLDSVTQKLAIVLPELIGDNSARATTRRHQIVDYCVRAGSIERSDLRRLP